MADLYTRVNTRLVLSNYINNLSSNFSVIFAYDANLFCFHNNISTLFKTVTNKLKISINGLQQIDYNSII